MGSLHWVHSLTYGFTKLTVKIIVKVIFLVKVEGVENIPKAGGVMFASNHLSFFDPPTVAAVSPRYVHFLAKEELFKGPIISAILNWMLAFPVKRGASDRQAIRKSIETLTSGNVLLIFPEGTRKTGGSLVKIERGIGLIALKAGVPIVPIYVQGKYKLFRSVTIKFGKPFYVAQNSISDQNKREGTDDAVHMIWSRMRELMEESQTGSASH